MYSTAAGMHVCTHADTHAGGVHMTQHMFRFGRAIDLQDPRPAAVRLMHDEGMMVRWPLEPRRMCMYPSSMHLALMLCRLPAVGVEQMTGDTKLLAVVFFVA